MTVKTELEKVLQEPDTLSSVVVMQASHPHSYKEPRWEKVDPSKLDDKNSIEESYLLRHPIIAFGINYTYITVIYDASYAWIEAVPKYAGLGMLMFVEAG